ncbi:hypothetical protein [Mucilaginibacter sp. HD30]
MKSSLIVSAISCMLLAPSCKSTTTNNIFATLDPSSAQYKKELIKHFLDNGTVNLAFNFEGLANIAGKDYMKVDISGSGIHAQSLILINSWNKLEDIKRTKGMGYHGAGLKDLKLDIDNTNGESTFVYRDLAKIID